MNRKAIIIGASSGIGEALAEELSARGYEVGLTARRLDKLKLIAQRLPTRSYVKQMDIAMHEPARAVFKELLSEMGDVDVVVINAGISLSSHAEWELEKQVIDVNVSGFVAIFKAAWEYYLPKGKGHIVGISSITALKGFHRNSVYCASKAFISSYMQGYRQKSHRKKANIVVTDIKPGFVETPLTAHNKNMFWVATPQKAARQIADVIEKKKPNAYITRRWRLFAWVLKLMPDWLFVRLPI
jgi:short-subunit dehydrogenase